MVYYNTKLECLGLAYNNISSFSNTVGRKSNADDFVFVWMCANNFFYKKLKGCNVLKLNYFYINFFSYN